MEIRKHRTLAVLLVLAMVCTLLPFDFGKKVYAAENGYKNAWCSFEDKNGGINYFYILTSEKEGNYPLLLLFPGLGGIKNWNTYAENVAHWMDEGLIDPVVLVMPVFNTTSSYDKRSKEYIEFLKTTRYSGDEYKPYVDNGTFNTLLSKLKSGDFTNESVSDSSVSYTGLSSSIDFSKDIYVSGYSMGGAISLYIGVKYRDTYKYIGALSPALTFYPYEGYKYGFISYADDIVFTQAPDAKLFMGYGIDEDEGSMMFRDNVNRYNKAAKGNGKNSNSFYIYDTVGNHEPMTFSRELFVFLRYVQKDETLNDPNNKEFLAKACGDYDHTNLDEGVVTKEPTCEEKGEMTYTCGYCKAKVVKEIPALGHDFTETIEGEVTCTTGATKRLKCKRCNMVKSTTIPATGHSWDDGEITKDPSCTEDGIKVYHCSKCKDTKNETIPALGHKPQENGIRTKEPTCTENGLITFSCERCHEELAHEEIPALGHSWDEGTVAKEPTATEKGIKIFHCTRCEETKEEVIPELGEDLPVDELPSDIEDITASKGDVNGDGKIDIEDVVMIINHINGVKVLSDEQSKRSDVDGNSKTDIEDAVAIIAQINGVRSLV